MEDPLAEALLRGEVKEGESVEVDFDSEGKKLSFSSRESDPGQPETEAVETEK
jgi:hypothetical protein